MTTDLEARVRRLEDRALISEQVIKYAVGVDRRDWAMFAECFTDPVYADFSDSGVAGRHLVASGVGWGNRRDARRVRGHSAPEPEPRHRVR